jgi:putative tryptophan/tyrosine transport system substrate-binding protein
MTATSATLTAAVGVLLLLAAPLAVEAQATGKLWRVGILVTANPRVYDSFVDELRELAYIDGQNLSLQFRNAEGKLERLPTLAAKLARAGVGVIVAAGGKAPLRAVRQVTTTIPVVIVAIDYDPLTLGYVASLARPGGNVTGVFLQLIELSAKRIELLRATLPKLTGLAILWEPSAADQFKAAEAASRSLGIRVQSLELRNPLAEALFVVTTAIFFRERGQIAQLAVNSRLPAVFAQREFADAGGLMSYGTNLPEMFRRAPPSMWTGFSRGQARGFADRASHQIRAGHQHENRQSARSHDSAIGAGAGRSSHRVMESRP